MEVKEKSAILTACRQYTDSKSRLRSIFPSLSTTEEIDNLAAIIVDVASSASPQVVKAESKVQVNKVQRKRGYKRAITVPKGATTMAPTGTETEENARALFLDRIGNIITESKGGKSTPTYIVKVFTKRGWKIPTQPAGQTEQQFLLNTLAKNQDRFTRRGSGVFGIRKRAAARAETPAKVTTRKGNVPPLEVFTIIERDFSNKDFAASGVAKKLGVHGFAIRSSFRLLHEKGFIEPVGKAGMPNRPWKLSAKSKKLNGFSVKAVAESFAQA